MRLILFASCCLLAVLGRAEQPSLLFFHDPFDVSNHSNDINVELERQTGMFSRIPYAEGSRTAPNGSDDSRSFLVRDGELGRLWLWPRNGGVNFVSVSPSRNFVESSHFEVSFTVQTALNDASGNVVDWTCVVVGSTAGLRFPNNSDGFGFIFRSRPIWEMFNGGGAGNAASGPLPGRGPHRIRIRVEAVDFEGNGPTKVYLFVNDVQQNFGQNPYFTREGGIRGNRITIGGYCQPGLAIPQLPEFSDNSWFHTFDNLRIVGFGTHDIAPRSLQLKSGELSEPVQVIPNIVARDWKSRITVRSLDPTIAVPEGGLADGTLILPESPASFRVKALKPGKTRFTLTTESPVVRDLEVVVLESMLENSSFEAPDLFDEEGYARLQGWQVEGLWTRMGGFADPLNGRTVPDSSNVLQLGSGAVLEQLVAGLDPSRNYRLEFYYNADGDTPPAGLTVKFDSQVLATFAEIHPSGEGNEYHYASIDFTPGKSQGNLVFSTDNSPSGALVFLDAIALLQREKEEEVIRNSSFEASGGNPLPYAFQEEPLAGWYGQGDYGVDRLSGMIADNGMSADQNHVLFLRGLSSASQHLQLQPGLDYALTYQVNANSIEPARLLTTLGSQTLGVEEYSAVGGNLPYVEVQHTFTATASVQELKFTQVNQGAATLLLDGIRLRRLGASAPLRLHIARESNGIKVSWLAAAQAALERSPDLKTWETVIQPPDMEGDHYFIIVPSTGSAYFRLRR